MNWADIIRYMERRIGDEADGNNGINVLITGFGPFRDHTVNASWEAVRLIPDRGISLPSNLSSGIPVNLVTYQIPVVYKSVAHIVPRLWDKHQPDVNTITFLQSEIYCLQSA